MLTGFYELIVGAVNVIWSCVPCWSGYIISNEQSGNDCVSSCGSLSNAGLYDTVPCRAVMTTNRWSLLTAFARLVTYRQCCISS